MALTIDQALQQGIAAYEEGKLEEAERIYRAILRTSPAHPDANYNLGALALSLDKPTAALPFLKKALEAKPRAETFWFSYIEALIKEKQFKNAKQVIEQAKKQGMAVEKINNLESELLHQIQTDNLNREMHRQVLLDNLLGHYQNGRFEDAEKLAILITQDFPKHQFAWKALGEVLGATGKKSEAVDAYKTAIALAPKDAAAHYNLGITLQDLGRLDEAQASYTQAVALKPDFAQAHCNLGNTLKELVRLEEALASYNKALALKPDLAEAHYNLGYTLKGLGRSNEALDSYKQAIALKPDLAEAHNNIGITLQELGRLDEAINSYAKAIALKPDYAKAHSNLGVTLQELGRLQEAVDSYAKAIALEPDYAKAHSNLGVALQELGRLDDAVDSYAKAISLRPNYAEANYNLGITLQELGRLDEAVESYAQAIALKPDYAEANYNLGNTFKELGRLEEAVASYTRAITLNPNFAKAHNNLGITLQVLGRLDKAVGNFSKAIALNPNYAEAHRHLTAMKTFDAKDDQYFQMVEIYLDESISDEQRCHINFALAKAYEDFQDFEKAFAHYGKANVLRKKLLNYDINQDVELFKRLKSSYPKIKKNSLELRKLSNDLTPIFIVGMPRSGTTLVEQIISSHSQVTGAGELSFAAQFGASIATGFAEVNNDSIHSFRRNYLDKLRVVSNGNLIVTDKMPHNFRYIGLLAAAFPDAKIVHVRRNPAAVCWANYKQYFLSKNIGYCYAIDDVVRYHKLYENLMEYWESTLSKRIYNLDYEQLTIDQDNETRLLIKYLALDWDEKCLTPQNNMRSVVTASNLQVRQKLYQGSSERWKKYQPFLNGAFDGLLSP